LTSMRTMRRTARSRYSLSADRALADAKRAACSAPHQMLCRSVARAPLTAQALDWSEAATARLLPPPAAVPGGLARRSHRGVVWIGVQLVICRHNQEHHAPSRTSYLRRICAEFEDGEADLSLDLAMYGVTDGNQWALLPRLPAPMAQASGHGLPPLNPGTTVGSSSEARGQGGLRRRPLDLDDEED
jgi:hypothetical protein